MSVMLDTSLGQVVVDLHFEDAPFACRNFLKLCQIKFYNNCLVHFVDEGFAIQTGDPSGTGKGGNSIWGEIGGKRKCFQDEIRPKLKHNKPGVLTMANVGKDTNLSQFILTLRPIPSLDGKHSVFGAVSEGMEILEKISSVAVDRRKRPIQNVRIRHTHILFDPFEKDVIPGLKRLIPEKSPSPKPDRWDKINIPDFEEISDDEDKTAQVIEDEARKKSAQTMELGLAIMKDKPDVELAPPDNVLFICKLNPVTEDEDLEMIFSRFGKILSCEIIRDYKTGDSLNYAFIEYETKEECRKAYLEMEQALIDERRIKVDFCQSVAKIWGAYAKGGKQALKSRRAMNANRRSGKLMYGQNRGRKEVEFGESHALESTQRLKNIAAEQRRARLKKDKRNRSRSRSREHKKKKKKKKKRKKRHYSDSD